MASRPVWALTGIVASATSRPKKLRFTALGWIMNASYYVIPGVDATVYPSMQLVTKAKNLRRTPIGRRFYLDRASARYDYHNDSRAGETKLSRRSPCKP